MKSKIVVLDGEMINPGDCSWEEIEALGNLVVYDRTSTEDELIERMKGVDIVMTIDTPITEKAIDSSPDLKFIGVMATGYNHITVSHAAKRGITVSTAAGYCTESVAQLVFALILNYCHHIFEHDQSVRRGDWIKCDGAAYWLYPLIELKDKVIGIAGFGRIGQAVGKIGAGFGMEVLAYDPNVKKPDYGYPVTMCSLDELLEKSDFLSLNTFLTPENRHMISYPQLEKMKDSAVLVNAARGALVNDDDLAKALNQGVIAAALLDVLGEVEPPPADSVLLSAKNCVITPHFGGSTFEARKRVIKFASDIIKAFQSGAPIKVVS